MFATEPAQNIETSATYVGVDRGAFPVPLPLPILELLKVFHVSISEGVLNYVNSCEDQYFLI